MLKLAGNDQWPTVISNTVIPPKPPMYSYSGKMFWRELVVCTYESFFQWKMEKICWCGIEIYYKFESLAKLCSFAKFPATKHSRYTVYDRGHSL